MSLDKGLIELTVGEIAQPVRVDKYVASCRDDVSRSLVADAEITINGKPAKNSSKVSCGDRIVVSYSQECFGEIEGEDLPLHILYEDADLLVVDKAQGMVVHPGAGNLHHTLVNALVFRYGRDFESGDPASSKNADSAADIDEDEAWQLDPLRPGIVHRLDKDTSGTMVIALNRESHRKLAAQFKEHTVSKVYIAICKGFFTNKRGRIQTNLVRDRKDRKKFTICQPPKGKSADTSFVVLRQFEGYALVRISIHTGRTHQIRVHMASIGHPLLGDPIYARPDRTFPQATLMLHSFSLELDHPRDGRRLNFRSPMPQRFKQIIRQL